MDEIIFRSSQRLENLQVQVKLAAIKGKDLIKQLSEHSKSAVLQAWNSSKLDHIKRNATEASEYIVCVVQDINERIFYIIDPRRIYYNITTIFFRKWTKRDVYFGCAGFLIGGIVGVAIGLTYRKRDSIIRYMQAIQCNHYLGIESAIVVEDAIAPYECGEYDVLVNVKAGSVQIVDAQICTGYGRNMRKVLRRLYNESQSDLPVILGRDCSGIIADVGSKVKRLEVGDEVWLTVPFWCQGTLSQVILISEERVSRKPKNIGFEGACSLPYAGSLALSALEQADINISNAFNKKVFVQGGCTPVGCVLIQLLKFWKAEITTTCYKRALPVAKALGADDIIILSETQSTDELSLESETEECVSNTLLKEMELKNISFDVIINTKDCSIPLDTFKQFCTNGIIVSTLLPELKSDSYGILSKLIMENYIWIKYQFLKLAGLPMNDYDETHLCHVTLDQLTDYVESGCLQTVVDKVFHPHDVELALNHIQSSQSIGSTVITFR